VSEVSNGTFSTTKLNGRNWGSDKETRTNGLYRNCDF
jgi:hypothetical protein